jgi:hypothetical protein
MKALSLHLLQLVRAVVVSTLAIIANSRYNILLSVMNHVNECYTEIYVTTWQHCS